MKFERNAKGRPNGLLDREDVCRYFSISKATVTNWMKEEGFPNPTRQGKSFYWRLFDIEDWVYFNKKNPPKNPKLKWKLKRLELPKNYEPPKKGFEKLHKTITAKKAKRTPDKFMTRQNLCDYFDVSIGTINRWVASENFPKAHNINKTVNWKLSEVENWVMIKKCTPSVKSNQNPKIPPQKAPEEPKQELLTLNPAFTEKVLQGVIDNITAMIQPKIEQELSQMTDQIINKVATDLLSNYGQ